MKRTIPILRSECNSAVSNKVHNRSISVANDDNKYSVGDPNPVQHNSSLEPTLLPSRCLLLARFACVRRLNSSLPSNMTAGPSGLGTTTRNRSSFSRL